MANNKFSNTEMTSMDVTSPNSRNTIIYTAKVLSTDDPLNAGRIKAEILPFDSKSVKFCKEKKNNGKSKTEHYKVQGNVGTTFSGGLSDRSVKITNPETIENLNKGNRDSSNSDDNCVEIPWAAPFSQLINMVPKVGELVKVILFDVSKPQLNRLWVGPIISQPNMVHHDGENTAGGALNTAGVPITTNKTNPLRRNRNKSPFYFPLAFPKKEDLTISSRQNADIVLPTFSVEGKEGGNITSNGEIILRVGKFKYNRDPQNNKKGMVLNDENISYFRLKVLNVDVTKIKRNGSVEKQPPTHAMLFSDFISIVSHKNGEQGSKGVSKINPIINTDEEIINTHNTLSPLIRGDRLVEFLELMVNYVKNHNHNYHGISPTNANSKPEIEKFDLQSLLSTNIRIN